VTPEFAMMILGKLPETWVLYNKICPKCEEAGSKECKVKWRIAIPPLGQQITAPTLEGVLAKAWQQYPLEFQQEDRRDN
jgi:hypothetical protein